MGSTVEVEHRFEHPTPEERITVATNGFFVLRAVDWIGRDAGWQPRKRGQRDALRAFLDTL